MRPFGIINDLRNVFVMEKGNVVEGRIGMVVSDLSTVTTELGAQSASQIIMTEHST